jgi:hypothetical protein
MAVLGNTYFTARMLVGRDEDVKPVLHPGSLQLWPLNGTPALDGALACGLWIRGSPALLPQSHSPALRDQTHLDEKER